MRMPRDAHHVDKLSEAIEKLNGAKNIPKCLKNAIVEMASRINEVIEENTKLREENEGISTTNCGVRAYLLKVSFAVLHQGMPAVLI
ncbi:unnamed protein product [Nippostrongylus brasiliensis]|uniref:Reverse transcriptase domain-containing protein n=1 Tax=Nippostrongylus brasiliensis TaxID=27835 RepID=A0A0N4Y6J7_NIPBR|nr:unnamed protein product [Nippostrongylus brasiliensis]